MNLGGVAVLRWLFGLHAHHALCDGPEVVWWACGSSAEWEYSVNKVSTKLAVACDGEGA